MFQSFVFNTFANKESSNPELSSVEVLNDCVLNPVVESTLMSETASYVRRVYNSNPKRTRSLNIPISTENFISLVFSQRKSELGAFLIQPIL